MRALSGCVQGLPTRQERLLTLRYGLGSADPKPAREVARALDLSGSEYGVARRRALRGLVQAARGGACEEQPVGSAAVGVYDSPRLDPVGRAVAAGAGGSGFVRASGAQETQAALTGGHFGSGGGPGETERRSGFTTPLALDKPEAPGASTVAGLALAGALALLSLIALKPALAGARRKRSGV